MSVRGSLRTFAIGDLLEWIDRRFACGNLTVERGSVVRAFEFDSGYVTSASSNVPGEHLGQMLLSRGDIDEDSLNEAFNTQAETGVLLGKVLVLIGAVHEDRLRSALEDKIFESLCDVLTWEEGTFLFDDDYMPDGASEFEISVNLHSALEQGRARADEWRRVRELIPTDDLAFFVADPARAQQLESGDAVDRQRLLDGVTRGLTVNQLILDNNGRRLKVLSALAELIEADVLAIDRRVQARRSNASELNVDELLAAARGRAAGGDRRGALELARRALDAAPENPEVQTLFRELERSLLAELSRELLGSFRIPKLLVSPEEIEALELDDSERYLAGRIDGRWDLLSLMRISPLRDVDVLITFKKLAERGIISL